jgi:hypothetical protein
MSKTFRCKGYEETRRSSWERRGNKIFGFYTHTELIGPWGGRYDVYRTPTESEFNKRFRTVHGESRHANQRSLGRSYRETRMNENRAINKQELVRWMKYPDDYEPLFESNYRSPIWDLL